MSGGKRVQIIDYKLGNLFSISQACQRAGMDAFVSAEPDFDDADGVILPGVGAFGNAMDRLTDLDLVGPLQELAASGKPLLGICLGMQLLFDRSEEFGEHEGLGLLPGEIRRIPDQRIDDRVYRVPNVGWNRISFCHPDAHAAATEGIPDGAYMYFVHSFYADPADNSDRLTETRYGKFRYCSAVRRGSILGYQFHPEKSGELGLRFYRNWAQSL